jgi:predicted CXXCH cytochrome family protein
MARTLPHLPVAWFGAILIAGCVRPLPPSAPIERTVKSNVTRADYAGSAACASCHPSEYAAYMSAPMHNMTRRADTARILAPFDRAFRFKEGTVSLEMRDGHRWMRIGVPGKRERVYRVTKVIGGHHREDFAGVEAGGDSLTEKILPASYVFATGAFRYKGYSVMVPERPGLRAGPEWRATCIFCHNTVPYLSTALGAWAGPGAPGYQGEIVDLSLPSGKRGAPAISDSAGLRDALGAEIGYLKASLPDTSAAVSTSAWVRKAIAATRDRFGEGNLVELGIGCESCHGGSAEHVRDPAIRPSLAPVAPFLRAPRPDVDPSRAHDEQVVRACARCHQVLFSGYPWTWEGGRRSDSLPGGAHINSGEGRDMLLGNCRIACNACHDPHSHDRGEEFARLEGPAGNAICLRCHGDFREPAALRAHAHHDPQGQGGLCLNCHMPRKNMSLDLRLSRYHRIASPDDPAKVEGDRPLECALCHSDRSVASLADTMEAWWGHHYDRARLRGLYGDSDANVLEATLRLGKPHERAVAAYLAGTLGRKDWSRVVAGVLTDPRPLVRYYADQGLVRLLGGPSPVDLNQDTAAIRAQASAWLARAAGPAASAAPAGELH